MKTYEEMMEEFRARANKKIMDQEEEAREQWLQNLKDLKIKQEE
jgi:hypothetical protein